MSPEFKLISCDINASPSFESENNPFLKKIFNGLPLLCTL